MVNEPPPTKEELAEAFNHLVKLGLIEPTDKGVRITPDGLDVAEQLLEAEDNE